jgi:hypothetical protein
MAQSTKEKKDWPETGHEYQYKIDYQSDWSIHQDYVNTFDAYEAMALGYVYDSVSNSVDGSKITDSYVTTLASERANRVMGKLPEGQTEAIGKADAGKAAFMDIIRQKWIYPNANAQQPFETKLWWLQFYSDVYGYMPMFYDWNLAANGYVGPDCWLWNPRNLVPQQGRVSITDMDYATALTWVGKKYLQDVKDKKYGKVTRPEKGKDELDTEGWNLTAIDLLLERVDHTKTDADYSKDTLTERSRIAQATKRGICLATRYESGEDGEWVTFAPDHGFLEVRRIKNPHKNGRIPFVIKYCQPTYDSFYGIGSFQRGKPLQFARDGLTNFYFKGIKMNLIPPIIANANGVLKHTVDYREGAVMMETVPNSIRRLETSTAGLSTYQAVMSALTGSLLAQQGSQNASIPGADALNPSQGKTPQAIDLYSDKEATRDGRDRQLLEEAIEQLTDGFFSLIANISTEEIPVSLLAQDIKEIHDAGLTDVLGLFGNKFSRNDLETGGVLKIDPKKLKNIEYRFNITRGTTAKVNKEKQLGMAERLLGNLGKFQNIIKDDPRIDVQFGKILQSLNGLSDIDGAESWVTIKDGPSPQELELQKQNQELQQQAMQLQQQMTEMQKAQQEQQSQSLRAPTISVGGNTFQDQDLGAIAQEFMPQGVA